MSQPIDDGGSAFPTPIEWAPNGQVVSNGSSGMTLRDYIAVHETIEANEQVSLALCEALAGPRPPGTGHSNPLEWFAWTNKWTAAVRYARADAMIEARKGGDQ